MPSHSSEENQRLEFGGNKDVVNMIRTKLA